MDDTKTDHLKVIQISDTHLFADDKNSLFGVNSNKTFQQLITYIQETELHDTDLILLTGDLSQDESAESYDIIVNALDPLNIPIYWIPGNHDNIKTMKEIFTKANNFFYSRRLSTKHWTFLFLNTKREGTAEGFLSDEEITALQSEISRAEQKPVAVVMHHHPTEVDTPLIDQYILQNNLEFWNIVSSTQVKLIICGHVHQDYNLQHNNIHIESSPASCFQFPKQTEKLVIEQKIGCKVYHLNANGYKTEVKWW